MRDPVIKKVAEMAAMQPPHSGGAKINVYSCVGIPSLGGRGERSGCGTKMVTIDREPGVTPFITVCPGCGEQAQSAFYRVDQTLRPTHEWYRPDTFEGLNPATIDHVRKGGLILREIVASPAEHTDPTWTRFTGAFENVAVTPIPLGMKIEPTVGVSANVCAVCQTHHVQIAAIATSGHEVNVGVLPEVALEIARSINAAALKIMKQKGIH